MKKKNDNPQFPEPSFAISGCPLFDHAAQQKPVNGKHKEEPLPPVLKNPGVAEQFKKCNQCAHKQTISADSPNWCARHKKRQSPCSDFMDGSGGNGGPEKPIAASGDEDQPFGPVIYAYTRAQAFEDGVLVDVNKVVPGLAEEAGFIVPVGMTRTVWDQYVEVPEGMDREQDLKGRLWDVLFMCHRAAKQGGDTIRFKLKVRMKKGHRLIELKAVCGPGDDGNPVITIMTVTED